MARMPAMRTPRSLPRSVSLAGALIYCDVEPFASHGPFGFVS